MVYSTYRKKREARWSVNSIVLSVLSLVVFLAACWMHDIGASSRAVFSLFMISAVSMAGSGLSLFAAWLAGEQ